MKNTLLTFALTISLALMTLPVYAMADNSTEAGEDLQPTTTATEPPLPTKETEHYSDVEAFFGMENTDGGKKFFYVGDTVDLSAWKLIPSVIMPGGVEIRQLRSTMFRVDDAEYAHCFTVDTSEVDMTKAGNYPVYFRSVPGEKVVLKDYTDGTIFECTMRDYTLKSTVFVYDLPEPYFVIYTSTDTIPDNGETNLTCNYNFTADLTGLTVTAEPEGIVEIGTFKATGKENYRTTVNGIKPGTVTITATTDSGLSSSFTINVIDHTQIPKETMPDTTEGVKPTEGHGGGEYWAEYHLGINKPSKLVYQIGEELDLTGGSANCWFEDSEGAHGDISMGDPLTASMYTIETDFDSSKPGTYTVWVTAARGKAKNSFTVEVLPEDAAIPDTGTKRGDLNSDGKVDILDVIRLNKSLLGVEQLTDEQTASADVDGNGKVESNDSLLILKYALEMIDSF